MGSSLLSGSVSSWTEGLAENRFSRRDVALGKGDSGDDMIGVAGRAILVGLEGAVGDLPADPVPSIGGAGRGRRGGGRDGGKCIDLARGIVRSTGDSGLATGSASAIAFNSSEMCSVSASPPAVTPSSPASPFSADDKMAILSSGSTSSPSSEYVPPSVGDSARI
jgi:hypothetical protein